MTPHALDLKHSASQIRRRLWLLLIQAFTAVVLLTIMLLLGLVLWAVTNTSAPRRIFLNAPPVAYALEGYYLGQGSWTGVESVPPDFTNPASQRPGGRNNDSDRDVMLLIDVAGNVLVDYSPTKELTGKAYDVQREDLRFPIRANGKQVGVLVMRGGGDNFLVPTEAALFWRSMISLVPLIGAIAFFTGLMTIVIGLFLMRRIVSPLVEVIAAARQVAAGDLGTRVHVQGAGDLRQLSESFNHMADSLERNDRERREMLQDIAHELRTPLTIMRGRLEGILDKVYPADEAHIAPALEETYLLERLVDDVHLLSLAEARQLHFDLAPINLGEVAQRVVEGFALPASEKEIKLTCTVAPQLPFVLADEQRVGQVIGNLINNALNYIPAQSEVEVDVRPTDDGVAVSVRDNGHGVPDVDLPKLFDRFWRAEKSRARASGGAGLGLAIAKQLIEGQGGTIVAKRAAPGGLEILFVLKTNSEK